MVSGSVLINKKIGLTSRQEVNNVSHALHEKKAGHIGTLDPFADGLLIVLLGSSTKIALFLEVMDKAYIATLKLGELTDTGDLTGNVLETKEVPNLTREQVNDVLQSFVGKQSQLPPMYSAIKINGKELYKYAREGKTLERKPREINIYNIKLLSFSNNLVVFYVEVSKGTYIRTLGEDIATKLGTLGHLSKLSRVKVGPYSIEDATTSDKVSENDLIPISKMLSHMDSITVKGELRKAILNGMHVKLPTDKETILVKDENEVLAIYKKEQNGYYACMRGLR